MWLRRYRTLWVPLLLVIMALVIISSHRREPGGLSLLERMIYGAARPFQSALSNGLLKARSFWEGYVELVEVNQENRRLTERIREMEQRLSDHEEIKASNERLSALLDFQRSAKMPMVASQVIGEDATGWFHSLLIDKGLRHGLLRGLPVVAKDGVVGQIIECADGTSKVLLIIDRNSALDVVLQSSRTRAVLEGTGRRDVCILKYVPRTDTVSEGDRVITSGLGGIYPKGLLVGTVAAVWKEGSGFFQRVEVSPQVDFDRLEEVLVVLKERNLGEGKPSK